MKKNHLIDEICGITIFACVILVLASLISYHKEDLPSLTSHPNIPVKNLIGSFGAGLAYRLFSVMGKASYALAIALSVFGFSKIRHKEHPFSLAKIIATGVLVFSLSSLFSLIFRDNSTTIFDAGGITGAWFSQFILIYFGKVGAYVIVITLMLLSVLLLGQFLLYPILLKFLTKFKDMFLSWKNKFFASLNGLKNLHIARIKQEVKVKKPKVLNQPSLKREQDEKPVKEIFSKKVLPRLSIFNKDKDKDRSEERRVGKECRSRWSPYH